PTRRCTRSTVARDSWLSWKRLCLRVGSRSRRDGFGFDFGFELRIVEGTEQLFVGGPVFLDRYRHPGRIHVVLEVDVLRDDVAAPGAAAKARGHRHAVVEGAGIGLRLWLTHHDPGHGRGERQAVDVVLVERIDPARMPLAANLV